MKIKKKQEKNPIKKTRLETDILAFLESA